MSLTVAESLIFVHKACWLFAKTLQISYYQATFSRSLQIFDLELAPYKHINDGKHNGLRPNSSASVVAVRKIDVRNCALDDETVHVGLNQSSD